MERKQRQSNVELLKVLALFFIVISHVTQSLGRDVSSLGIPSDYLVDISHSTKNIVSLVLAFFRYFGALGNTLFFICSSWYLCDKKQGGDNKSKIFKLIVDIWVVSVLILIGFIISGVQVSNVFVLKSFFPTTFSNNWYMTTYILFYLMYDKINVLIDKMKQKELFISVCLLIFLYCGFGAIKEEFFCGNSLTNFITIYFFVSYMKKYMLNVMESLKYNTIVLIIGIILLISMFMTTNILGLKFEAVNNFILHWNRNNNIVIIIISIATFNLSRKASFVNPFINYISSLSFLIYIIHENLIVSAYFRPYIWIIAYLRFGHKYLILQVLLFSVAIFIVSIVFSFLYKSIIMKITSVISEKIYRFLSKLCSKAYIFIGNSSSGQ